MKVLHLISGGDTGGAKSHVLSLVNELGNKIDVKIITFVNGTFTKEGIAMGINIEVVKTGSFIGNIRKLLSIINAEQYQIIHSHGSKGNLHAAVLKFITKLPSISTVHSDYRLDYLHSKLRKYTFGLLNSIALRIIDYQICVSAPLIDVLKENGFKANKIFSLVNGINFDIPTPNFDKHTHIEELTGGKLKKENLSDKVIVGILARLTPIKGIDVLLDAMKILRNQNSKVILLIAGDGDAKEALLQKSKDNQLEDMVFFTGHTKEPDKFLHSLDITVMSSYSEGFPYTILEGARAKKATVSTAVGDIPKLIIHNETGLLSKPGNANELAENILKLVNNAALREKLGIAVFEKAKTDYSLETMCQQQLDIYKKILKK